MLTLHGTKRPYECELCGGKFKINKGLRDHLRRTHKIENLPNLPQRKKANQWDQYKKTKNISSLETEDDHRLFQMRLINIYVT